MKKNLALQIFMCVAFGAVTNCELQSQQSAQGELEIKNQIKEIGAMRKTPKAKIYKKNQKPRTVASQKKKEIKAVSINTIEDFLKFFEDKEKYDKNVSIAARSLQNPSNLKNMLGEICKLPKYLNIDINEVCNHFDDNLIVYYGENYNIPEFTTIEPFYAVDTSIFDLALALRIVRGRGSVVFRRLREGSIEKLEANKVDESFYILAVTAIIYALSRYSTDVEVSGIFFRELAMYLYKFLNNTLNKENAKDIESRSTLLYKLYLMMGEVLSWRDVSAKERLKFVKKIYRLTLKIKRTARMNSEDIKDSVFGVPSELVKKHFQKLKTELLNDVNSKEHTKLISSLPAKMKKDFEEKIVFLRDDINKIGNDSHNIFRLFLQIDTVLRAKSYFKKSLYEAYEKETKGIKKEQILNVETEEEEPTKAIAAHKNGERRKAS